MITGAHWLIYSPDADADRAFVRDLLRFRGVDAGGGWLIFALPPAELAFHPVDPAHGGQSGSAMLYLMCDDLHATMASLRSKNVPLGNVTEAPYGTLTTLRLPSGVEIGLYQPTHPTAIQPP